MYDKIRTFRTTKQQHETLKKMKSYNIDVSKFIREAIKEKIQKEYKDMIPKIKPKNQSSSCQKIIKDLTHILG